MVVEQLRCAGVIEAIRISRAGFPARMPLKDFVQRFQLLVHSYHSKRLAPLASTACKLAGEAVDDCRKLMAVLATEESYQVGRTRASWAAISFIFLQFVGHPGLKLCFTTSHPPCWPQHV